MAALLLVAAACEARPLTPSSTAITTRRLLGKGPDPCAHATSRLLCMTTNGLTKTVNGAVGGVTSTVNNVTSNVTKTVNGVTSSITTKATPSPTRKQT